jgi:hypothetical protein
VPWIPYRPAIPENTIRHKGRGRVSMYRHKMSQHPIVTLPQCELVYMYERSLHIRPEKSS